MTSIALKHKKTVLEKQKSNVDIPYTADTIFSNETNAVNHYQLMFASLSQDIVSLRKINSISQRLDVKLKLLEKYSDYLNKYRASGVNHKNSLVAYTVIWLFDLGEIEQALTWSDFAIEQNQPMPDNFSRDLKTYVADEVLAWSQAQLDNDSTPAPYLSDIFKKIIEDKWDLHEAIIARFYKLAAMLYEREGKLEEALNMYKEAQSAFSGIRVKTKIDKLTKELKK